MTDAEYGATGAACEEGVSRGVFIALLRTHRYLALAWQVLADVEKVGLPHFY